MQLFTLHTVPKYSKGANLYNKNFRKDTQLACKKYSYKSYSLVHPPSLSPSFPRRVPVHDEGGEG